MIYKTTLMELRICEFAWDLGIFINKIIEKRYVSDGDYFEIHYEYIIYGDNMSIIAKIKNASKLEKSPILDIELKAPVFDKFASHMFGVPIFSYKTFKTTKRL